LLNYHHPLPGWNNDIARRRTGDNEGGSIYVMVQTRIISPTMGRMPVMAMMPIVPISMRRRQSGNSESGNKGC
jgi:hypothetical protein